MKWMPLIYAIAAGFALTVPAAQAADQEGPGACRAEWQKYCQDVQPGGGHMMQCLKQHEADLSPECRERIAQSMQKMQAFADACRDDAQKLCKDTEPGQGRVMRCLVENRDQLSPACREKIDSAGKRHPCMDDAAKLCAGVQPGGGRLRECLKSHESELSAECKAQMSMGPQNRRKEHMQ